MSATAEPRTDDQRWTRISDALTAGDEVSDDDLAFAERYEAGHPEARAENELIAALADLGEGAEAPADDAAIVDAAISGVRGDAARGRRTRIGLVAGGAVAAAAALVLWGSNPASTPASTPAPQTVVRAPAQTAVAQPGPAKAEPAAVPLWVEDGCVTDDAGAEICGADEARFRQLALDSTTVRVELDRGQLSARAGTRGVEVVTPIGRLETRTGAFDVRLSADAKSVAVVVILAPVTFTGVDGSTRELPKGQTVLGKMPVEDTTDGPPPAKTRATPAELLEHAQELLGAGQRMAAERAYRRLLKAHPRSPESHAATVSLAKLELRHGRARSALRHFDRYLARGGPASEEARHGRIEALKALGRTADERAAIEAFLGKHPRSVHTDRLRRRADELR